MANDDGEWSVVEHSRNKRRKIKESPDGYPSINFYQTRPERVELKALQDLALYVLADGVAPSWLAVKNAKDLKKVVILMVPGLDRETLRDSTLWDSIPDINNTEKVDAGEILPGQNESGPETDGRRDPNSCVAEGTMPDEAVQTTKSPNLREFLLQHVLQVRAPGDSSMSRVHSPLQSMLRAPLPTNPKSKNGKEDRNFQAVRTPISNFVHSAEELRDAEYPIHPAELTDPQDARSELERREKTGQSISAGWVDTKVDISTPQPLPSVKSAASFDHLTRGLNPYALDCEMVLTTDDKYSLARISLVDWAGKTILDKYVRPSLPIKNYFTEFSGITEEILKNVTTTLEDIQKDLLEILGQDSILLGHSLESDLNALKLTHPFVVDTSIIYPHPRGLPLRSSLKFLANRYLRREIQRGGVHGHDSVEDARAVLDLVKLKCEKGPAWGTLEANGESIFRRIQGARNSEKVERGGLLKTSAIVEYGTPERGLGKEATYHIACDNDDEIVRGVLRAARGTALGQEKDERDQSMAATGSTENDKNGEQTGKEAHVLPVEGVDFIWARLHDLEAIRSWNTLSDEDKHGTSTTSSTTPAPQSVNNSQSTEVLKTTQIQTLHRVLQIYASLPPRTLFVVYSGTADMRPLLRLQNMHAQYKREFKVKKWDELSIKWTDKEEQEMKKACEFARRGVGVLAVSRDQQV